MYFCYNIDNSMNSLITLSQYDYDVWSLLKLHLKKLKTPYKGKTTFSFKHFPQYDLVIKDLFIVDGYHIVEVVFEDESISNARFYITMNCDDDLDIVNTVVEKKTNNGKKTRFVLSDTSEFSNTNGYGNILAYHVCEKMYCNEYPENLFN